MNLEPAIRASPRPRTLFQRLGYDILRVMARCVAVWLFGLRVQGREHWPASGGGLVCANHQSHFDPPLVGMTCSRRMNYLARDTLFNVPGLKQLIHFLDAIPIDPRSPTGEPIRYRKDAEALVVWGVGDNGSDDGGDVVEKPGHRPGDVGSVVPTAPQPAPPSE